MSRARTGSRLLVPDSDQSAVQTWHALVDTLRLLPSVPADDAPASSAEAERRTLSDALDKLSSLLAARRASPAASPSPDPGTGIGTGTGSGSGGGGGGALETTPARRKRPLSGEAPPTGGSESALSSVPSPLPRVGTPGRDRDRRRDGAGAGAGYGFPQLAPRRKVVVRPPRAKAKKEEDDAYRWILAAIKGPGEKGRYEVVDEDDGTTWLTSSAHIIPLPDPLAPLSSPAHPANAELFPRHARVLALYPDTTEFYSATVVAPPSLPMPARPGASAGSARADPRKRRQEEYALEFEDDGETVQAVAREMVVAYPE
ncbi:hypothetical protein Q5752_004482 [Cryptotrichosporon argae]